MREIYQFTKTWQLVQVDLESRLIASAIVWKPYANRTYHEPIDGILSIKRCWNLRCIIYDYFLNVFS